MWVSWALHHQAENLSSNAKGKEKGLHQVNKETNTLQQQLVHPKDKTETLSSVESAVRCDEETSDLYPGGTTTAQTQNIRRDSAQDLHLKEKGHC